tara:strand:+ start:279 stop:482 length:204 start_codon:yes stop_codon:yes gene_type:complete
MNNYQNVDVDKLANIYFEGKVINRNIFLKNGLKKTLGVILESGYDLKTALRELMQIHSGKINIIIRH